MLYTPPARAARAVPQPLTAVVVLQFVGVVAMLYLPSLNADIIDKGVATGDTGYIVRTGGVMLGVALLQVVCVGGAVWFGARTSMSLGRDLRRRPVPARRHVLRRARCRTSVRRR